MELGAGRDRGLKARSQAIAPGKSVRLWRLGLGGIAAAGLWLGAPITLAQGNTTIQPERTTRSTRVIIRQLPASIQRSPIIVVPYPHPTPESEQVRVEFDARGTDWGAVYLNDRLVYRPGNFDRQETLYLPPGGYRLEITGVVRFDRWASGYLDLGRDNSRLVVIRFSKTGGVEVSGSPYVWIPD